MSSYVVVPDPQVDGSLATPGALMPQYVLVVDGRPEPITVTHQVGPASGAVILLQGRRGSQGPPGLTAYELAQEHGFSGTLEQYLQMQRGFILLGPDDDNPPTGTYDFTWAYQEITT